MSGTGWRMARSGASRLGWVAVVAMKRARRQRRRRRLEVQALGGSSRRVAGGRVGQENGLACGGETAAGERACQQRVCVDWQARRCSTRRRALFPPRAWPHCAARPTNAKHDTATRWSRNAVPSPVSRANSGSDRREAIAAPIVVAKDGMRRGGAVDGGRKARLVFALTWKMLCSLSLQHWSREQWLYPDELAGSCRSFEMRDEWQLRKDELLLARSTAQVQSRQQASPPSEGGMEPVQATERGRCRCRGDYTPWRIREEVGGQGSTFARVLVGATEQAVGCGRGEARRGERGEGAAEGARGASVDDVVVLAWMIKMGRKPVRAKCLCVPCSRTQRGHLRSPLPLFPPPAPSPQPLLRQPSPIPLRIVCPWLRAVITKRCGACGARREMSTFGPSVPHNHTCSVPNGDTQGGKRGPSVSSGVLFPGCVPRLPPRCAPCTPPCNRGSRGTRPPWRQRLKWRCHLSGTLQLDDPPGAKGGNIN